MPLVRTPMIVPTAIHKNVSTLSPEDAADLIAQTIAYKPVRIATRMGILGEVVHAMMPRMAQIVMNTNFCIFPDSDVAKNKDGDEKPTPMNADQIALQQLLSGIHF